MKVGDALRAGAVMIGCMIVVQGCRTAEPVSAPPPVKPAGVENIDVVVPPPSDVRTTVKSADELKKYTVKKGDTLSLIAQSHGIRVKEITEINNIKASEVLRVGQALMLPAHAKYRPIKKKVVAKPKPVDVAVTADTGATVSGGEYSVVSGDSLDKIAKAHGTSIAAIKKANNLTSDRLSVGQKLVIPGAAAPAPAVDMMAPPPMGPVSNAVPSTLGSPVTGPAATGPAPSTSPSAAAGGSPSRPSPATL